MSQLGRRPFSMAMVGFPSPRFLFPTNCSGTPHLPSLSWLAFDPEVGTNRFYALWSVIALMKAGWYAAIRVLLLSRLERPIDRIRPQNR
jgi:hypothetical protein